MSYKLTVNLSALIAINGGQEIRRFSEVKQRIGYQSLQRLAGYAALTPKIKILKFWEYCLNSVVLEEFVYYYAKPWIVRDEDGVCKIKLHCLPSPIAKVVRGYELSKTDVAELVLLFESWAFIMSSDGLR
jgi:hypothetical protein